MRPLQLNVRGLHSFRKEQTIDFSQLCDGGVFGIFGPTGSGKSSILDAMTFALYGKISRSGSVGASMINQSETEVAVSFSFRLGNRTFIADRRAKRKDTALQTTRSRFIETTEEPVVLADKKGAMDREIEMMIGLKIEDFTRAVVLPQNKFSEFLSLKGAERSKMLQRLFDLEKYGDELNEKIKKHLAEASAKKDTIEAEQNGLGDASEEALTKARQTVVQVENALHREETLKEELETKWQRAKEILQQQKIEAELENELASLSEERPHHEKRRQALRISAIANQLLPYREEQERSEREQHEAEKALKESSEQVEKLVKKEKEAQDYYRKTKEKRQAEEPQLTVKIAKLEEAKGLEAELQTSAQKMEALREEESRLSKEKETADNNFQKAQETETNAKRLIKEKEELLNAYETAQSSREKIRQAFEKGEALRQQAERLDEEKSAEQIAVDKVKQQEAYMREEKAKRDQLFERLKSTRKNLFQWFFDLSEAKREQQSLIATIKDMQAKKIHASEAKAVQALVSRLEKGDACPVCGSTEHPAPGHSLDAQAHDRDLFQSICERLEAETSIDRYRWELERYSEQITAVTKEKAAQPPIDQGTPSHPKLLSDLTAEDAQTRADQFLHKLEAKTKSLDTLLTNTKQWLEQAQQHTSNLNEIDALYKQTASNREDATMKKQKQETIYEKQKKEWHESFPDHSLETIHEEWQTAQKEHEQQEELREDVRQQQKHLESLRENIKEIESKRTNVQMFLLQRKAEREHQEKEYRQAQVKLEEALGENTSATKALADAEETLRHLQNDEKTAEENYQKTTTSRQEAEQTKSAAEEQYASAHRNHALANERWEQQKNTDEGTEAEKLLQGALDSSTLKGYALNAEKRNEYETQIQRFETKWAQTKQRLAEVEEALDGKRMTEEEWGSLDEAFQQKKEQVDQKKEERSVARSKWEDLQEKHHRYVELEEERQQAATKIGHYQELERVFKGKAFVNYIAEEQLVQVTRHASERLHALTQGRYALALDSDNNFLIADYFNGGQKRPTSTLSGGETFLTSLALALSLSVSIQLRGQYPLEFFFLDEGFGTLDAELLDTVVNALEQLQTDHLAVGVISHVPELQERLHKRLLVEAPKPDGQGSCLTITS
ncbi:SMC family ATPase [Salicibibacter cibarius]|uniref:Nuclease SbcCD subunit C n=1 Tax=Salicibibacter cibarius TaxID=2743000 RepID=A0A7T6Z3C3_9BACI|nr:SMC family ATPase [Salicibibacter cibarius]QQK76102.1 SMC family ATPase [Salicibibacter cibarius]